MHRVFLDANVLFSAGYRPDAGLLRLWRVTDATLLTSAFAVQEARANLTEPGQRERLTELLVSVEVLPHAAPERPLPEGVDLPPGDRQILLGAVHARATHLLTGDLRHFGPHFGQSVEGVLVLAPGPYLRSITSADR